MAAQRIYPGNLTFVNANHMGWAHFYDGSALAIGEIVTRATGYDAGVFLDYHSANGGFVPEGSYLYVVVASLQEEEMDGGDAATSSERIYRRRLNGGVCGMLEHCRAVVDALTVEGGIPINSLDIVCRQHYTMERV